MDFKDAVKSHYYHPVVQDLSGEILANKYPSMAGKCQYFHDGALVVRGQTFNGCVFKNLTISGGATFISCSFDNCEFHARNEHGENVLSIFGGNMNDCSIRGFYHKCDFLPDFCKAVTFLNGFASLDFATRFNCAIWDGCLWDDKPLAGMLAFILRSSSKTPTREEIDLGGRTIQHLLKEVGEELSKRGA